MNATASHTPGPWIIDNGGDHYDINTNGEGGPWSAIATVLGANKEGAKQVTEEEAAANANLIAAAPELLQCLRDCIEAYEQHRDGQPTGHLWPDPNHIHRARLALKRLDT